MKKSVIVILISKSIIFSKRDNNWSRVSIKADKSKNVKSEYLIINELIKSMEGINIK